MLRCLQRSALLLAGLAVTACGPPGPSPPERIVLIVVDTLRRDHLSVYGSEVETPNIDALAARGQVFENLIASFHQTSMSMAAMFTGRTPSIESGDPREPLAWNSSTWCGLARFASRAPGETCIPRAVPTLAERLREAGYRTIGVASNQFLYEPSGFGRGFDDWTEVDRRKPVPGPRSREGIADPARSRYWRVVNQSVFEALERGLRRWTFLYVHYLDVHDHLFYPQRSYAESVVLMDRAIGHLFEGLEERGFLEDAVVILTSDHGERLGEDHSFPGEFPDSGGHYGNPSFEELLRVPLIVAPPVFEDTSRFLRTQDVFYLIQEIAGLAPERAVDTHPGELFVGELLFRTYRKDRWKSTIRRSDGEAFLYDLETDPEERNDLSQQKRLLVLSHRTRLNQLTQELRAESAPQAELSEEDKERLRILGYLDDE
ncbi:MAG: sulfatase [Deltaproteobacteria bacterium]|nr:sulfatase [Deltaproteobacteria bacterium]